MDQNERMRLKKQYGQYADGQILAMLEDGPNAFVEGAYELLKQEAQSRGLSLQPEPPGPGLQDGLPQGENPREAGTQPTFVEIMVINTEADKKAVDACLETTEIPFQYLNINVRGKEMPLALLVDQQRIDEAIALLQRLPLSGSIVLW